MPRPRERCDLPIAHGRIVDEVEALVAMGMPVSEALDAASAAARRWLGAGVFDDGDRADVLILDADPREDLSALRRPREIICGGVPIRG